MHEDADIVEFLDALLVADRMPSNHPNVQDMLNMDEGKFFLTGLETNEAKNYRLVELKGGNFMDDPNENVVVSRWLQASRDGNHFPPRQQG